MGRTTSTKMSRQNNGHRVSESEGMVWDSISQKPNLNITRAVKQYMYEANNVEYLDCCNSSAHVGHCHPQVVGKGQQQMGKLITAQGFISENLRKYVKSLGTKNLATSTLRPCQINTGEDIITVTKTLAS